MTKTTTAGDAAWQKSLALIALPPLIVFAYCLNDPSAFTDGDTNWHVAAGRWMLAQGRIPHTDPISYTFAGRPWVAHEWLSEVILALSYAAAGWGGVLVALGVSTATAYALLAEELRRWMGGRSVALALVLSFTALIQLLLARPHMIALPVMAFWTIQLLRAREARRAPSFWLLPVMTLWANLHGGYIFGIVFIAPLALEALLADRARWLDTTLRWGAFGVSSVVAALLTPHGVDGLLFPFRVMLMTSLDSIQEWNAVSFQGVSGIAIALFVTLFVALYRGVRVRALRLLLLLLLLAMTLRHMRQETVLAIVAPLLLAEPFGRALQPGRVLPATIARVSPRDWGPAAAVILALFVGLAGWRAVSPITRQDGVNVPVSALDRVPSEIAARPVFNDYSFGGWLAFSGLRPFIDGRADMYGDGFLTLYRKVEAGDPAAVQDAFGRYGVRWTILNPRSRLIPLLDHRPGWRRLYADKWAVVHVLDGAPPNSAENGPPPPAP